MHGCVIAVMETVPVVIPRAFRNVGVAELIPAFDIGRAVMIEVLAGSFNAVVETLTLDFAEFARGGVPSALVGGYCLILRGCECMGRKNRAGYSHRKREN